ncbi:LuxR C-terminal-related transcriptional regulator [Streptomyces sp. Ag109_O5-1]|uniref:LuxR C-terminal-related transcriptional regulator n=1 Tax=Streptomyces sp. Ag109_O5-1 TaxID=1938851 RepID=UPI0021A54410|nr:LuxR C-terminal-related transcriptional regulator [Streptomyces sp. Ag109_O5-1]
MRGTHHRPRCPGASSRSWSCCRRAWGVQEIGPHLGLSEQTVRNYLSNIYANLGVRNSTEAVPRRHGASLRGADDAAAAM